MAFSVISSETAASFSTFTFRSYSSS